MGNSYRKPNLSLDSYCGLKLFFTVSFAVLFVFFTVAHPLYLLDLDDWLYASYSRHPWLIVGEWNPSRILPEILMPFVSSLGAFFVYPLLGDYVQSLSLVYALFLSGVILIYVYTMLCAVRSRFDTGPQLLTLLAVIFLMGHFAPFLAKTDGRGHLFYSENVTCLFYYIIPGLFNFSLCAYFLTEPEPNKSARYNPMQAGFLIVAVYLAIVSNLFQSIILMALFGSHLLLSMICDAVEHRKHTGRVLSYDLLKTYVAKHFLEIAAILFWFLSMVFEIKGGRAASTAKDFYIEKTLANFWLSLHSLQRKFLFAVAGINIAALLMALARYKKTRESKFLLLQLELGIAMALTLVFLILLCAVTFPFYIKLPRVMLSWMGWLMMMTLFSLAYIAKHIPKITVIYPFLAFVLAVEVILGSNVYADTNYYDTTSAKAKAVVDDIIGQIQEADEAGYSHVTVHTPKSRTDGWPLDTKMCSRRIPYTLYRHGVTENLIEVTILADEAKDMEYGFK